LTIDLSNILKENSSKILIISSLNDCIYGKPTISYTHIPYCYNAQFSNDSSSLYVFVTPSSCNLKSSSFQVWEVTLIVIGIVLVIAILTVVIIFSIPSLREKILPFKSARQKRQEEINQGDL